MIRAVAQQPVLVVLHASDSMVAYAGGIYMPTSTSDSCYTGVTAPNHLFLIVGYNTTHDPPYW